LYHHVCNKLWRLAPLIPFVAGACGPGHDGRKVRRADTAAMRPASANSANSLAAAAPGSNLANALPDVDHAFLRAMSDKEWGLILLAHESLERDAGGAVYDEAVVLDRSHGQDIDSLYTALRRVFHDNYAGKLTPADSTVIDSLAKRGRTAYDSALRQAAITLLRQSIVLTDRYLPTSHREEVRSLAERLEAMHQREINALQEHRRLPRESGRRESEN
jgi:hypothetical protein